jgi:hypothetical protein
MHATLEIKCTDTVNNEQAILVSMTHGPSKMRSQLLLMPDKKVVCTPQLPPASQSTRAVYPLSSCTLLCQLMKLIFL